MAPMMHCVVDTGGLQACRYDDGDGAAELHGETPRGGVEGQLATKVAHDVVPVCLHADDERAGSEDEDPGRHRRFAMDRAGFPDVVDCGEGADCTGRRVALVVS